MTADDFRLYRSAASLTQVQLAEYLRIGARMVRYYESGTCPIPGPVAKLMEMLDTKVSAPR